MITGTVTAKPQVFAAAVKWAAKFVAGRPTVPIQGGLRLTIEDETLIVECYGENVQGRAVMPVAGSGAGSAVVSGRLLAELVGTFPTKPVEIGGDEQGVTLAAGRWEGTLPVLDGEWPTMAGLPETIGTVDGGRLADMIGRVAVAASHDTSKQIALACVHLTFHGDRLRAVATDSTRIGEGSVPFSTVTPAESALVVADTLREVTAAFAGPDPITIGIGAGVISLSAPTRSIILRQIGEQYLMAEGIDQLLDVEMPRMAIVRVADLLGPMKRAALMRAKDGPVAVAISDGLITVNAAGGDDPRKGAEDVDADYAGPDHLVGFNPDKLSEALASAPTETVEIRFNEVDQRAGRPWHIVLVAPDKPGDNDWRHVLMPMKIQGGK